MVYLQTIPDEKYKGRVVGFYFSLLVSVSIGSILGGLISEFIGVRPTVYLAMACLMAIHSIAFMSFPVPLGSVKPAGKMQEAPVVRPKQCFCCGERKPLSGPDQPQRSF